MGNGVLKRLMHLAIPITLVGLLDKLANIAGILFVAQLGKLPLAASALGYSVFLSVSIFAVTCLFSVGILCGHAVGEQAFTKVGEIFRNGLLVVATIAVPASAVIWHGEWLLEVFKQDAELIQLTVPFFHYISLSLPFFMFACMVAQFYNGIKRPKVSLVAKSLLTPLRIGLSYVFVLGKFGAPTMGLPGVALAMLITQVVACIGLAGYLLMDQGIKQYALFSKHNLFSLQVYRRLFGMGLPIGIQFGAELAAIAGGTYMLGQFGASALAAGQIVSQYVVFTVMFTVGLSQALSIVVSEAYGQNSYDLITQYKKIAVRVISAIFLVIAVIYFCLPKLLMMPFVDIHVSENVEVVKLTMAFFMVAAFTMYFDAIRNMFAACLRGLHLASFPMVVGVICLWCLSLPVAYLFGFVLHDGPVALRIGFGSGFVVAVIILQRYLSKVLSIKAD